MDDPTFVDTNVFLRFFVRDVEPFYQKAKGYKKVATFDIKHFKNIEGIIPIW